MNYTNFMIKRIERLEVLSSHEWKVPRHGSLLRPVILEKFPSEFRLNKGQNYNDPL